MPDEMLIEVFTQIRKGILSRISASNTDLAKTIETFVKEEEAKNVTNMTLYQRLMSVLNSMNNLLSFLQLQSGASRDLLEGIAAMTDQVFNIYIKKANAANSR